MTNGKRKNGEMWKKSEDKGKKNKKKVKCTIKGENKGKIYSWGVNRGLYRHTEILENKIFNKKSSKTVPFSGSIMWFASTFFSGMIRTKCAISDSCTPQCGQLWSCLTMQVGS